MSKLHHIVLAAALAAAAHVQAQGTCNDCGVVQSMRYVEEKGKGSGLGLVAGGVVGGVLGHQIGGGRGNDVATALGAVGGVAVGANVNRGRGGGYTQDVRRCSAVPGSGRPEYWDVTYVFRGREHRAQLSSPPGATITVNGLGEPRL